MAKLDGIKVAVDFGTQNTLVYVSGHGIVYNEKSVVTFERNTGDTVAIGNVANEMKGREHSKLSINYPIQMSVISDTKAAITLLNSVLDKIGRATFDLASSTIMIYCPSEATDLEKDSLKEIGTQLGFKEVFIEEEIKAGVIGLGRDIYKSQGTFFIDLGAGSIDLGVISLGEVVISESIRFAGDYFDTLIIKHIQNTYDVLIGELSARKVKIALATLKPDLGANAKSIKVAGRNLSSGLPVEVEINQNEIRDLLVPPFEEVVRLTLKVLEQTPPELSADIILDGIYVSGGGALIDYVPEFMEAKVEVPIKKSKHSLTDIIEGSEELFEKRGEFLVK
jgi:rod shape-determining protein MreB